MCFFLSFLQPMEVYVDDEAKLTLHGLQQHYVKLKENEKNKKLFDLLDALEFNQVHAHFCFNVFVKTHMMRRVLVHSRFPPELIMWVLTESDFLYIPQNCCDVK